MPYPSRPTFKVAAAPTVATDVLPGVVADFNTTALRVSAFAVELGISVHVAGDGATSVAAISNAVTTRMESWKDGVVAVPVIGPDGPVAVLTAADEARDPRVADYLHQMRDAVLERLTPRPVGANPVKPGQAAPGHLSSLVGSSSLAFMVVDLEGRVVYANPLAELATGKRAEELVGRSAWDAATFAPHATDAPAADDSSTLGS